MKYKIFLFFFALCFITCQQSVTEQHTEKSTTEESAAEKEATPKETNQKQGSPPSFVIDYFTGEAETPRSTISLNMDGKIIEVTEAIGCQPIQAGDYQQYQIPDAAVDACGGWWAGMGEYFYIIKNQESDYYMVMKATVDEQQESPGYEYQSIMNIVHKFK